MSQLGQVRIGQKAPDFHCEAVVAGVMKDVTLGTYINEQTKSWLILLFIPAAFSFVCPTEVLAFQNCIDEFKDRNCEVVFISVDTKHSLWHWQNVPRRYGGLGQIGIALLSDATHRMSRSYGVLVEEEGVCLRGMFILDDEGVVQQITLNNLTVGRSVLEALRLLEAFQAVAKHGDLCPVDWKPDNSNTADTISTISSMLTESYDERLANLQKEFGESVIVTDLDAKLKQEQQEQKHGVSSENSMESNTSDKSNAKTQPQNNLLPSGSSLKESVAPSIVSKDRVIPSNPKPPMERRQTSHSSSTKTAPPLKSSNTTPTSTSASFHPPILRKQHSQSSTTRHTRGQSTAPVSPHKLGQSDPLSRNNRASGPQPNMFESQRGTQVILEFADPIASPQASPIATPSSFINPNYPPHTLSHSATQHPSRPSWSSGRPSHSFSRTSSQSSSQHHISPSASDAPSPVLPRSAPLALHSSPGTQKDPQSQTRLQATFEAIKTMSSGLISPRSEKSPRRIIPGINGETLSPGYFDVSTESGNT